MRGWRRKVLFDEQFEVKSAVKIPHAIIEKYARYMEHVHAHILVLRDDILNDPMVGDLTAQFIKQDAPNTGL